MPDYPYDDLLRDLSKGKFHPALYLYGSAEILKDEVIQQVVRDALDPSARELNYEQRSAGDLDPESLHTLLETLPMFGGRRVVVLRGLEALKKKPRVREVLLAALGRNHDDTLLILVEAASGDEEKKSKPDADLVKATRAVAVDGLDPERTVRWVQHRAQGAGVRFAEGAAEHLAEATGHDLGALKAEIDKLSALPNSEAITIEQVGDLVGIRHGETANDWRIAVLEDDPARALKLLGPVLLQSGNSGVKLVSMLGTALVAMWLARSRYDQGDKGGRLVSAMFQALVQSRPFGVGDWKKETERWARLAPQWPARRVRAALRASLAADQALKETRISDERGVMTDLVLTLAGTMEGRVGGRYAPAARTTISRTGAGV